MSEFDEALPFHFTREDAKIVYHLGERLILHDKFDVGNFSYRHRPHYWNGKREVKHMSPFHHWVPGFFLLIAGQLMGTAAELKDTYEQISPPAENKKDDSLFDDLLNIY
jgi:hypothetical protein